MYLTQAYTHCICATTQLLTRRRTKPIIRYWDNVAKYFSQRQSSFGSREPGERYMTQSFRNLPAKIQIHFHVNRIVYCYLFVQLPMDLPLFQPKYNEQPATIKHPQPSHCLIKYNLRVKFVKNFHLPPRFSDEDLSFVCVILNTQAVGTFFLCFLTVKMSQQLNYYEMQVKHNSKMQPYICSVVLFCILMSSAWSNFLSVSQPGSRVSIGELRNVYMHSLFYWTQCYTYYYYYQFHL